MWPLKKKKPKVFCGGCKFYLDTEGEKGHIDKSGVIHLYHDFNFVCKKRVRNEYDEDDALDEGTGKVKLVHYRSCLVLNRKNDCFFFEKKVQ
jgi:hypothetical protein